VKRRVGDNRASRFPFRARRPGSDTRARNDKQGATMSAPTLASPTAIQTYPKGEAGIEAVQAPSVPKPADSPQRLASLDAYRGFIMLVLAAGGFGLVEVAKRADGNFFLDLLATQFDHVPWVGCAFWDLIQPSFMFMVGVAMPYSYANRKARGRSAWQNFGHVVYRSIVLILLGVFLSTSISDKQTNFAFVNVLTQIGLGYAFVYLLLNRGVKIQLAAIAVILAGYWLYFYRYPAPGPDFDFQSVGVAKGVEMTGLFAHWNKNTNAAAAFDVWFLNLFPRAEPFRFNEGGYQTLNFIPSMATMIFGLMAGELLRGSLSARVKLRYLLLGGAVCLVLGVVLGVTVCPNVKRIWTPTWALFSAGLTFYILAGFYWMIDIQGYRRWAFPLVVFGMNSIAIYLMGQLLKGWVRNRLATHLGQNIFDGIYGPLWASLAVLLVFWLVCFWMYRRKIFLRI
jgi:predicted acyltransferase